MKEMMTNERERERFRVRLDILILLKTENIVAK